MAGHVEISMKDPDILRTLEWQAGHAEHNDAPCTGRLIRAFIPLLASDTQVGERMRNWPGMSLEDAMPLRLSAGFHYLHLAGADERLGAIYSGELTDQAAVDALVLAVARDHDAQLLEWFAVPPQTNEAGRSAGIMAQFLWLSQRLGPRFELNEIGASAGINTMMARFRFDLGGVEVGPPGSPMLIRPEWLGAPPPQGQVEIVAAQGCDVTATDLADPEAALRLKSYVWPDAPGRLQRVEAAIQLAREHPPMVAKADAADWLEQRLEAEQPAGVTRVLFHTIVWQYLSADSQTRIETAMATAGARATSERPLAWVTAEIHRETFRHELRCRYWPGGEDWVLLGESHAHGRWLEWFGG